MSTQRELFLHCLLIIDTLFYRTKNKKINQKIWILSFVRTLSEKYGKQPFHTATKTGLDTPKTPSKRAVHKAAVATGKFKRNEIADKIVKPKPDENSRTVEKKKICQNYASYAKIKLVLL